MDPFSELLKIKRDITLVEKQGEEVADFIATGITPQYLASKTRARRALAKKLNKPIPRPVSTAEVISGLVARIRNNFAILQQQLNDVVVKIRNLPNVYMPLGHPQLIDAYDAQPTGFWATPELVIDENANEDLVEQAFANVELPAVVHLKPNSLPDILSGLDASVYFNIHPGNDENSEPGTGDVGGDVNVYNRKAMEKFIKTALRNHNFVSVRCTTTRIHPTDADPNGTKQVTSRVMPYDGTPARLKAIVKSFCEPGYADEIIAIKLELINQHGQSRILRLANYELENCLINILRTHTTDKKIEALYKKFPTLIPNGNKIYVSDEQINKIAKYSKVQFRIFTPLGIRSGDPWCEYGYKGKKQIDIIIENEHATIIPTKRVDSIVYVPAIVVPTSPDVSYVNKTEAKIDGKKQTIVNYYVHKIDGKYILHKVFKPSSITNNPDDDTNMSYAYFYKSEQLLANIFCSENKIYPIFDDTIRRIILNAERFIGKRRVTEEIPANAIAIDRNRHYSSAEFSPYYIGFPEDTLVIGNSLENAVYIIANVTNLPRAYLYFYNANEQVFTRPEYNFLITRGVIFDIKYTLNAELRHISIYDWINDKEINTDNAKLFVNSLIGRLIAGGIKQTEPVLIEFANESERDRLIIECNALDQPYKIAFYDKLSPDEDIIEQPFTVGMADLGTQGYVRVAVPNKRIKGKYNFHAYTMAYASVAMFCKLEELLATGYTLHAYNVDCLVVSHPTNTHKITREKGFHGDWKYESVGKYYMQLHFDDHEYYSGQAHIDLPDITPPTRKIHTKHTAIIAPAGLGKSYEHLTDPAIGQMYTTPTHDLKNEIKRLYPNIKVNTAHKIFQFTVKDDKTWLGMIKKGVIPSPGSILVLDELTMYDQTQIKLIIRRANLTNTIVVALGDFCQITQNINGAAITEEFIEQYFEIETKTRTPESHARHKYDYGLELDGLRDESHKFQKHWLTTRDIHGAGSMSVEDVVTNYTETSTRVVVGNHERANIYHRAIKQQHPDKQILCRYKDKKLTSEKLININDPLIWWDKHKMADQIPNDKKYEPHFAATVDSFQGKTQQVIVDPKGMKRHGVLYTAITRSPTRPWWVYEHLNAPKRIENGGGFDDQ